MKNPLLSVALTAALLVSLPVLADNWLENSDFSSGIDHWRGDGRSPDQYAQDNNQNPLDKPDPFFSKGLILPLRSAWNKIQQDFRGHGTHGVLTLTYQLSPNFSFSDDLQDYQNVGEHIGFDFWSGLNIPKGQFIAFIADFSSNKGESYHIPLKAGTGVQTLRMRFDRLTPGEDKTITLGFPPGTGQIVFLNISFGDPDKQENILEQ